MSLEQRDRAYDNMAAVPDAENLRRSRLSRSLALRAGRAGHLDLPYGNGERNRWDIFPGAQDKPCLIFIHGGYWQRNDRQGFAYIAEGLMRQGWSVALPGYTLAPHARLSRIAEEIGGALDWFAHNRRAYGIEGPVLLAGWSAGATLAMLHAEHPAADAVLAVSGIYELEDLRETSFNQALRLSAGEVEALSPLRLPPPRRPRGIFAVGANELPALVAHSRAMARHVRHWDLLEIADADHFTILEALASADGALTSSAARLMRDINPG